MQYMWLFLSFFFFKTVRTKRETYNNVPSHTTLLDNRIVGGLEAEEGIAPYQVSIQTIWGSHICGGAIIDKQWIVTAGHCMLDFKLEDIRVIVGTNDRLVPGQLLYPELALVHCMYDIPAVYNNDIALVRLNHSIVLNDRTKIIELCDEHPPAGDVITLTGWGAAGLNLPTVEKLQTINLTVIEHKVCKHAWDGSDGVHIGHLCTLTHEGKGACSGDSGGPLVWKKKLVAVVNWGAPCARGKPDMHADLIYYRDWIRRGTSMYGIRKLENVLYLHKEHGIKKIDSSMNIEILN